MQVDQFYLSIDTSTIQVTNDKDEFTIALTLEEIEEIYGILNYTFNQILRAHKIDVDWTNPPLIPKTAPTAENVEPEFFQHPVLDVPKVGPPDDDLPF